MRVRCPPFVGVHRPVLAYGRHPPAALLTRYRPRSAGLEALRRGVWGAVAGGSPSLTPHECQSVALAWRPAAG